MIGRRKRRDDECQGIRKERGPNGSFGLLLIVFFFYFLTNFLCSFLVPYLWRRRRTTGEWGWRMTRESLLFLYSYYSFLTNFYICFSIVTAYLWCQWQRRRITGLDECNYLQRCRNRIFFSSSFFVVFRLVCPLETITIAIEILLLLYLTYHSFISLLDIPLQSLLYYCYFDFVLGHQDRQ